MKRPSKSFEIALSAIACAIAALSLTMGAYVSFMLAVGYVLAIFALMIPLSKGFWGGAIAAPVGAFVLAFLFCGFSVFTLLPFAVFFGLHPIVNFFQKKYAKKWWLHLLCFLVKAVWFDGALLLMWFTLDGFLGFSGATWYPFVAKYLYYIVFFGASAMFAAYDFLIFLCQRSMDAIVKRIRR